MVRGIFKSMEQWDIYDENRNRTGKIVDAGAEHGEGEFHLVVTLCLFDHQDRMLIQRRSEDKALWPGLWDVTVGGSAIAGENSREAIQRETREELGLDLELGRPAFTVNYAQGFDDVYVLRHNVDIEELAVPNQEVAEVRWVGYHKVIELMRAGQFLPYRESVMRFVWDFVDRPDVFHESCR